MPGLAAVALPACISMMGVFITHQPVGLLGDVATFSQTEPLPLRDLPLFCTGKKKWRKIWGLNGWMSGFVGGAKRTDGSV